MKQRVLVLAVLVLGCDPTVTAPRDAASADVQSQDAWTHGSPATHLLISPLDVTTNVAENATISVLAPDEATLEGFRARTFPVIQNAFGLLRADGTVVEGALAPAVDGPSGVIAAVFTPAAPLAEGWYVARLNLDATDGAHFAISQRWGPALESGVVQNRFHVGSLPIMLAAMVGSDAARLELVGSEPLDVAPGTTLGESVVTVVASGAVVSCVRDPSVPGADVAADLAARNGLFYECGHVDVAADLRVGIVLGIIGREGGLGVVSPNGDSPPSFQWSIATSVAAPTDAIERLDAVSSM